MAKRKGKTTLAQKQQAAAFAADETQMAAAFAAAKQQPAALQVATTVTATGVSEAGATTISETIVEEPPQPVSPVSGPAPAPAVEQPVPSPAVTTAVISVPVETPAPASVSDNVVAEAIVSSKNYPSGVESDYEKELWDSIMAITDGA